MHFLVVLFLSSIFTLHSSAEERPNFVIIFTDDQGYGDLSCNGGTHVATPRIDQMAAEGQNLTSFYVAGNVCTPSRAALMTGCYPKRVGMAKGVCLAADPKGLHPDEITIAEVLRDAGYATGMFGKWHLGDQPEFLPTRQGFDEFFGLPYSHDIHPFHPQQKRHQFPPLPLLEGEEVMELDPDADLLTQRFTERAVDFIARHKDEPFFLYLPHPIPHKPLHVSPEFAKDFPDNVAAALAAEGEGKIDYTAREELLRQAIAEIDASVGTILDALKEHGIDERTLVLFSSDNGAALRRHASSSGPLRGQKGSTFEGGMRVPTVVRWPGTISSGNPNPELMTAMDLLPSFAALAGAKLPDDRTIDGKDITEVLTANAETPHRAFFYYGGDALKAVRSGDWKLHLKGNQPTALFDLETDIGEKVNVLPNHLEVANRLISLASDFQENIAAESRPAAHVANPVPLSLP